MKRILHCIESLEPSFGGPVSACSNLAANFSTANCSSEVLTLDGPSEVRIPHAEVHRAGPPVSFYRYCKGLNLWLEKNLGRFDLVLIHGLWRHHSYGVRTACRRSGVPYYVLTHSMLNPWFNRGLVQRTRKMLFWRLVEQYTLQGARGVIFGSIEEQELAARAFSPLPGNKVVRSLGIADPRRGPTPSPQQFLDRFPQLDGKPIWLFLGRLHPVKGCDILVEAFAAAARDSPDVRLVIAGPDTLSIGPGLKRIADSLGLDDRVVLTGGLFGDEKWSALSASELFILPSHCESLSFSLLEAIALGCPALITNKVNTHKTLAGGGGVLVADDSVNGLIGGIQQWISLGKGERARMGQQARRTFLDHFEIGHCVGHLLDLFQADLHWKM